MGVEHFEVLHPFEVRFFFVFFWSVIFSVFVNNNNPLLLAAGRGDQGKPHQLFPVCSGLVSSNSKKNLHDINIQAQRLNWLFSKLGGEGAGMMDVLYCVLNDSPEALNMMQEEHIRVIISLLEKFGRDPKVGLGKFRIVSIKCWISPSPWLQVTRVGTWGRES